MPIPELERLRVGAVLATYCEKKVPRRSRNKKRIDYRFEGNSVILFESRLAGGRTARWRHAPIAKFRYLVGKKVWALYRLDGRGRWQKYSGADATSRLKGLLAEVERDPQKVFQTGHGIAVEGW